MIGIHISIINIEINKNDIFVMFFEEDGFYGEAAFDL